MIRIQNLTCQIQILVVPGFLPPRQIHHPVDIRFDNTGFSACGWQHFIAGQFISDLILNAVRVRIFFQTLANRIHILIGIRHITKLFLDGTHLLPQVVFLLTFLNSCFYLVIDFILNL